MKNGTGIRVKGSYSIYQNILAANNSGHGIYAGDLANYSTFQSIVSVNNGTTGFYFYGSDNVFMTNLTAANNGTYGLFLQNNSDNTIHNSLLQNNLTDAYFTSTTRNTLGQWGSDTLTLSNVTTGKFTNHWTTSAAPSCSVSGGTNPGLTAGCGTQGSSDFTGVTGNGTFAWVGQIHSDDTANGSNSNGVAPFTSILDWTRFENPFRGWGKGGAFPGASTQGNCSSGICQIWDFRLDPSDTRFRNTTADGSTQNAAFVAGNACPAHLSGNVVTTDVASAPRTYLTNAAEILGTGGNDNGLCESNETCLYTPHFGAYQGEGDYWAHSCAFQNGTVTNVTMHAYPIP